MTGVRWSDEDFAEFSRKRAADKAVVRDGAAVARRTHNPQVGGASPSPAPSRQPKQRPEEELQKVVAEYLDYSLVPPARWLHIPNQRGTRAQFENELLKAMGVKAGAADVLVFTPGGRFIWIELKSETGRLSAEQQDWRDWAQTIGAPWFLCRSLADVIEALTSCQVGLKGRLT